MSGEIASRCPADAETVERRLLSALTHPISPNRGQGLLQEELPSNPGPEYLKAVSGSSAARVERLSEGRQAERARPTRPGRAPSGPEPGRCPSASARSSSCSPTASAAPRSPSGSCSRPRPCAPTSATRWRSWAPRRARRRSRSPCSRREIAPRAATSRQARSRACAERDRRSAPTRGRPRSRCALEALEGLLSLWDVDAGWIYLADDDGLALTPRRRAHRRRAPRRCRRAIALGEGALGRAALERRAQVLQAPGGDTGAMIVAPMLDVGPADRRGRARDPPEPRPTGRQELLLLQALSARLAELSAPGGPRIGAAVAEALRASAPRGRPPPGA